MKTRILIASALALFAYAGLFADALRVKTLGSPLVIFDDIACVDSYASRLQDFKGASVFFSLSSALTAVPGISYAGHDLLGLLFEFNHSAGARPAIYTDNPVFTAAGGVLPANLVCPVYLIYGARLGALSAGLRYQWGYVSGHSYVRDTANNTYLSEAKIDYNRHIFSPSVTLHLDSVTALDVALNGTVHSLDNWSIVTVTNSRYVPGLQKLGVTAMFTTTLLQKIYTALQIGYSHADDSYTMYGPATSTEFRSYTDSFNAVLGVRCALADTVDVYGNLLFAYTHNLNVTTLNGAAGATNQTNILLLPHSMTAGGELKLSEWRLRAGLSNAFVSSQSVTTAGNETGVSASGNSFSFMLGGGFQNRDWTVNAELSLSLFINTVYFISGNTVTPFAGVSVSYLFGDGGAQNETKKMK